MNFRQFIFCIFVGLSLLTIGATLASKDLITWHLSIIGSLLLISTALAYRVPKLSRASIKPATLSQDHN